MVGLGCLKTKYPLTIIICDEKWTYNINIGENNEFATKIRAYLTNNDDDSQLMTGGSLMATGIYEEAVVMIENWKSL